MRNIILASTSPRRKALLQQLIGDDFEIKESSFEEDNTLDIDPIKLAERHALGKAKDVAQKVDSGIVIGADTFILFEKKVIGKPVTEEKARETLNKLSGNVMEVLSGLAVIDVDDNKEIVDHAITKIKIKKLSQQEIEDYIKSGEPLDKAGAFGIQERGGIFIEKIDGCYFNVVGLPLFKLNNILNKLGVSVFDYK